ncbi:hypothetical protein K8I31_10960, partial [bacterium]|nr:hypothetical protein [bacterium]
MLFPFVNTADVLDEFELDAVVGSPKEIQVERIICDEGSRAWLQGELVMVKLPPLGNVTFPGAAPLQVEGLLYESASLRFDDEGRPVAMSRIRGATQTQRIEFFYNDDNLRDVMLQYGPDGSLERKETYAYDGAGRKTMWTIFDGQENWIERHQFVYDDDGNVIKEQRNFSRPPREENIQYRYEKDGGIVWMEHFDAKGDFLVKHFRMYDEAGRFIGETYFDKSGEMSGDLLIARNPDGHEIDRRIITLRGGEEYRGEFKVNEKGLRTEVKESGIKGRLLKHEWLSYFYDEKGNWTLRGAYRKSPQSERRIFVPMTAERRTIQYADEP